jgi:hypothetical protein
MTPAASLLPGGAGGVAARVPPSLLLVDIGLVPQNNNDSFACSLTAARRAHGRCLSGVMGTPTPVAPSVLPARHRTAPAGRPATLIRPLLSTPHYTTPHTLLNQLAGPLRVSRRQSTRSGAAGEEALPDGAETAHLGLDTLHLQEKIHLALTNNLRTCRATLASCPSSGGWRDKHGRPCLPCPYAWSIAANGHTG